MFFGFLPSTIPTLHLSSCGPHVLRTPRGRMKPPDAVLDEGWCVHVWQPPAIDGTLKGMLGFEHLLFFLVADKAWGFLVRVQDLP